MPPLSLKMATGDYGHTRPLKDGTVTSEWVAFEHVEVPNIINAFRRMIRDLEFDVSEMALSTYLCACIDRGHTGHLFGDMVYTFCPPVRRQEVHHSLAGGDSDVSEA